MHPPHRRGVDAIHIGRWLYRGAQGHSEKVDPDTKLGGLNCTGGKPRGRAEKESLITDGQLMSYLKEDRSQSLSTTAYNLTCNLMLQPFDQKGQEALSTATKLDRDCLNVDRHQSHLALMWGQGM